MAARPSSRRMTAAKATSARRPLIRPAKQVTEDMEFDSMTPVAPSGNSSESAGSSRRMRSNVSSRRAPAHSGSSAPLTAPLTDEEREERAKSRKQGLILTLVLVAVVVVGACGFVVLMRPDPTKTKAEQALGTAKAELFSAGSHLDSRRPHAAKEAIEAARTALAGVNNTLGGSIKVDLVNRLADLENRAVTVERDVKVADYRSSLLVRFGQVSTISEDDLARLVKEGESFVRNPLDPSANVAADGIDLETYRQAISEIQAQIPRATSELVRRTKARTTTIVAEVRLQVDGLCQEERFAEAAQVISTAAAAHPQADLNPVKADLDDVVSKAWSTTKTFAETRLADSTSKGLSESQRKQAREAGRARLQKVIDGWGLPDYVAQAKTLLATFE